MSSDLQRRFFIAGALALPVLAGARPALAHREKLTSSVISWRESRQTLEINHIFHIHHAEVALANIGIIDKPDLLNMSNQARLALYVEDSFSLSKDNGETLNLTTLGAEADSGKLHVYQEVAYFNAPTSLRVTCSFLRPPIADQINEIHLDVNNKVSSTRLSGRQTQKLLIAK